MRVVLAVLVASAAAVAGCGPKNGGPSAPAAAMPPAQVPIAVTSRMDGSVSIVDRSTLAVTRTLAAGAPSTWPMLAIADPARNAFYVGNLEGALAKVPFADEPKAALDVGGPSAGLALSPDGKRLAVAGVKDLSLTLVDPDAWTTVARASLGNAADPPKRKPLSYGVASPHPVWLADGSGVVVPDNVHEALVLVGRDGSVRARRAMRSAVHTVLVAADGSLVALAEGAQDGSVGAAVVVLTPALEPVREIEVPLADGEPPKLHHGALSPDGELLVVANMGGVADASGVTVAAVRWKTGEVAWTTPTVRAAAHVAFLSPAEVIVLGHRAPEMKVLDAGTGAERAVWEVLGTASLGHALSVEPDGSVLVLDGTLGRVLRFKAGEQIGESERVGDGYAESSLPE